MVMRVQSHVLLDLHFYSLDGFRTVLVIKVHHHPTGLIRCINLFFELGRYPSCPVGAAAAAALNIDLVRQDLVLEV